MCRDKDLIVLGQDSEGDKYRGSIILTDALIEDYGAPGAHLMMWKHGELQGVTLGAEELEVLGQAFLARAKRLQAADASRPVACA